MPTTATPNLLTDPGFLFWAPVGTAEPTNTVVGSKFTDAWPGAWLSVGATEDGSTFKATIKTSPVMVAEFFDPIKIVTIERSSSFMFAMVDITLSKLKWAMNGGALTIVSGTTTTQLNKFEPPDPGTEVRSMIGWESLDSTLRIVLRQTLQSAEISPDNKKAPAKAALGVEFQCEVPTAAKPWAWYSAGTVRA